MNIKNEFEWKLIYETNDNEKIYTLEKIFYSNTIPCHIKEDKFANGKLKYSLLSPIKYEELANDIVQNALIGNLDTGIIYEKPPETPEDKVVIDHSYEVKIPKRFFWIGLVLAFYPFLLSIMSKWF